MSGSGSSDSDGFPTQQGLSAATSEFNYISFIVQQSLAWIRTCQLVQIKAVHNGDTGPVGTVDAVLLINMMDGQGNTTKHDVIHNLPVFRLQGGTNAIICDPAVNDIGFAGFCDRDISSAKKNKAISNPGSFRQFDLADGVYFGGVLNGAPTQYVRFSTAGIDLKDANGNTIVADTNGIKINGVLFDRTQHVSLAVEYTANGGHTLTQHQHHQGVDSHGDTEQDVSVPFG